MRQESSLPAISSSLNEEGMSLREAYAEFSVWNYFTGNRADTLSYYTEGRNYPEIKIRDTLRYQNPLVVFSDNIGVQSLGVVYHRLFLDPGGTISVVPIILKANLAEAGNGSSESYQYTVRSSAQGDDSFIELQVQGYVYWVKVGGVGNLADWSLFHVTDSTIVAILSSESLVYPNPFYIPAQPWVRFQIPQVGRNSASLYIFSSNLDLTFSDDQASRSSVVASPFFMWNGRKANGEYASSGIYFYVIQLDDQHYTGKFTLIRK